MYSVHNSGQVEGRSLDKVKENTAVMVNWSLGRSEKKKKGHGHDTAKLVQNHHLHMLGCKSENTTSWIFATSMSCAARPFSYNTSLDCFSPY